MKNYGWSSLMIKFNETINNQIISFANQVIPIEYQSDPENGSGIVTDPHISLITDLEINYPEHKIREIIKIFHRLKSHLGPFLFLEMIQLM